jgi:hypothetical protein
MNQRPRLKDLSPRAGAPAQRASGKINSPRHVWSDALVIAGYADVIEETLNRSLKLNREAGRAG